MMRKVAGLVAAAGFLSMGCEGCFEEDIGTLQPFIRVDACQEAGVRSCTAGFGGVRQNQSQTATITISNEKLDEVGNVLAGPVDLTIGTVAFTPNSDPAFAIVEDPSGRILKGGESAQLVVRFSPLVANALGTQIIITSDGSNLADGQTNIVIDLSGVGEMVGVPNLTVTPPDCAFGEVGVGVTASCDVSFGNTGNLELMIQTATFSPETPPEFIPPVFPVPFSLPPGSGTTMRLQFRPSQAVQYAGKVILTTSDPAHATVEINLTGTGGAAPTAVARVDTINGTPNNAPAPTVKPLDNVVLTGVDSMPGTVGRTITGYAWEFVSKPMESTVQLSSPTQMTTGFTFNISGQNRQGLDVAGTFVVRLTVTDSMGQSSTNDARVTLNAVPQEDFHVQITWDDPSSDMDLHLVRGIGPRWGTNDCHFTNCKTTAGLNWGGGEMNPRLDVDDTNGFGPENINIDSPAAGNYSVGVHWYSGGAATIAVTVKIYVQGALLGEYIRELNRCNSYWDVARVIWGSAASIQTLDMVSQETRGSCR